MKNIIIVLILVLLASSITYSEMIKQLNYGNYHKNMIIVIIFVLLAS